jgi:broad specificity phosphatase PhoE
MSTKDRGARNSFSDVTDVTRPSDFDFSTDRPFDRQCANFMSSIVFVRHAQASLFEADYDQLSDLGLEQARQLGQYLARHELVFDEIYTGPRKRHRQTADEVAQQYRCPSPETVEIIELDEHHLDQLATQFVHELAEQFPTIHELQTTFQSAVGHVERQTSFARLFEAVADLWVTDRCPLFGVESWPEFHQRVNLGISRILAGEGRGKRVLVFTSAGVIAVALRRALACPDDVALGLSWRTWNCSITEFAFSTDRFSLDRFNAMPHLDNRKHWTYR